MVSINSLHYFKPFDPSRLAWKEPDDRDFSFLTPHYILLYCVRPPDRWRLEPKPRFWRWRRLYSTSWPIHSLLISTSLILTSLDRTISLSFVCYIRLNVQFLCSSGYGSFYSYFLLIYGLAFFNLFFRWSIWIRALFNCAHRPVSPRGKAKGKRCSCFLWSWTRSPLENECWKFFDDIFLWVHDFLAVPLWHRALWWPFFIRSRYKVVSGVRHKAILSSRKKPCSVSCWSGDSPAT